MKHLFVEDDMPKDELASITAMLCLSEQNDQQLEIMSEVKIASTQHEVLDLIKNRWSARSFSEKKITQHTIETLIEAASWAFSGNNEQPWRFITALKGEPAFDKIVDGLMPGNTPWAKNAGAFIVSIAKTTFDKEGNPPNPAAAHDLGAANMLIALQALSMDIYCHPMGGFSRAQLSEAFGLPDDLQPQVVIALGYLADAEQLEEPYRSRELAARTRKHYSDLILDVD